MVPKPTLEDVMIDLKQLLGPNPTAIISEAASAVVDAIQGGHAVAADLHLDALRAEDAGLAERLLQLLRDARGR